VTTLISSSDRQAELLLLLLLLLLLQRKNTSLTGFGVMHAFSSGVNFTNILLESFFAQKYLAQLFSTYSFGFAFFFGK